MSAIWRVGWTGWFFWRARSRALLAACVAVAGGGAVIEVGLRASTVPLDISPAQVAAGHRGVARSGLAGLPVALRALASSTLGAGDSVFRVLPAGRGGWSASGGGIQTTFGPSGPTLRVSGGAVSLRVSAVGRGAGFSHVRPPRLIASGNQVVYDRGQVREWYRNGPLGLEQGFTVSRRPRGGGGLVVSERFSGGLVARLAAGGLVFFRAGGGQPLVRYGGLSAVDATGRSLSSRLQLRGRRISLRVDDARARYPVRIDPLIQRTAKLTASNAIGKPSFGYSVALASDGSTALIGGPNRKDGVGAVWVFTRSGATWTQQGANLIPSHVTGSARVGSSVALSGDGNTALIGGRSDHSGVGAAWVFTRSGQAWTQQGPKLTPSDQTETAGFGGSVALSSDGSTALVGGPSDHGGVGATWVFTRSGQAWAQQGPKLTASGETGDGQFGCSVALSGDGSIALIGGRSDHGGVGAAWMFTRSGQAWVQHGAKLTPSQGAASFGGSVALSADGSTALIGGPSDRSGVGAAWVFTRSSQAWTQQGPKLTPGDGTGDAQFGWSVALSADASTALIGGRSDHSGVGAAWAFTRSGHAWAQEGAKLTPRGVRTAEFGWSVALSADGSTALIGGPYRNYGVGAAWVFVRSGQAWTQQGPKLTPSDQTGTAQFGWSVALSADGSTALIGAPSDHDGVGAAWVFTRSGQAWAQQGAKLAPSDQTGDAEFGWSVALSADGSTALIGGPYGNYGVGTAWVFVRSAEVWGQQGAKLAPSDETGTAQFGWSVALSGDGSTALIGGPNGNRYRGAAWVFARSGEAWAQQGAKLTPSSVQTARFGQSVALSADGSTALIGGRDDRNGVGAAWVFTRPGHVWKQQGTKLTPRVKTGDTGFGWSVALSDDASTALIGSPNGSAYGGAAWVFTRSRQAWAQRGPKLTLSGVPTAEFGWSVTLSADGTTVLVGDPYRKGGVGAAWVFMIPQYKPLKPHTDGHDHVGRHSARVTGTVNPRHESLTHYYFRYSRCSAFPRGAKTTPTRTTYRRQRVSATLRQLDPGTRYCYQLVTFNSRGRTRGSTQRFRTRA